jgi:hypothetical protein
MKRRSRERKKRSGSKGRIKEEALKEEERNKGKGI